MNRRLFLSAAGAAATAAGAVWLHWPERGWFNPCRAQLPCELAESEIVQAAWAGIETERVWDCHVHLIGVGDSPAGAWINPRMQSWLYPIQFTQRLFFLNAGCAHEAPGRVDESYVERLRNLVDGLAPGVKLILLAFDHTYTQAGERDLDGSAFHTPDSYAQKLAAAHPRYFEWAASIHPYRRDCVQALEWAASHGARAVKWLPAAMGIDPASPRCDAFYAAASRLQLPLLTHAGEERAVHGAAEHAFGNPLKLRRALDHGMKVIVAHCASMGQDRDLDRSSDGPATQSFELFARMMDDAHHVGQLFGDISAIAQINRAGPALRRIIERTEWHDRLLNGSDYPLPGIIPLFSIDGLIEQGFVDPLAGPVLEEIREHNPFLFDFVLKRELHWGAKRFPAQVFHTRDFFLAPTMNTSACSPGPGRSVE